MKPAVLDTDIVLDILHGRAARVQEHAQHYRALYGRYTITAVTVAELARGSVRQGGSQGWLDQVLAQVEVLPLDTVAARLAGQVYGELERVGQGDWVGGLFGSGDSVGSQSGVSDGECASFYAGSGVGLSVGDGELAGGGIEAVLTIDHTRGNQATLNWLLYDGHGNLVRLMAPDYTLSAYAQGDSTFRR
jgi:predicted nucleic acid-binding protein